MPTQRIAWDFVDPEVMEMAANSLTARHPELSWDKLMGDTTCDEQSGRNFADRIIGKAAATRACATSSTTSCATTTGRARKPRSGHASRRPSRTGRRDIEAGKRTGTRTGRSPDTGHATADTGQSRQSQAGRQRAKTEADPIEEGTA